MLSPLSAFFLARQYRLVRLLAAFFASAPAVPSDLLALDAKHQTASDASGHHGRAV
jgi:hypothetical protein